MIEKENIGDLVYTSCLSCGFKSDKNILETWFEIINENDDSILVVCPKCKMTQIQNEPEFIID